MTNEEAEKIYRLCATYGIELESIDELHSVDVTATQQLHYCGSRSIKMTLGRSGFMRLISDFTLVDKELRLQSIRDRNPAVQDAYNEYITMSTLCK